jgi:sugar lactone lactonase YvrE
MKQHQMTEFSSGHGFLEAPRWRDGKLWLSDFFRRHVITIGSDATIQKVVDVENSPSGLGFLDDGSVLIVSQHDKKVLRLAAGGAVSEYADISGVAGGIANDMLVTPSGDAYVGNFGFDLGSEDPKPTRLAHVSPQGTVTEVPGDVMFPNGIGLSPGGESLLLAETFGHRISTYDVQNDGSLTNHRGWAELAESVSPDGITVDSDGGVWFANALTEGPESGFYRVEERGEITDVILVPDAWAVACTFGGPDNDILYLVCNATTLADFAEQRSHGMVRTANVGRRGS